MVRGPRYQHEWLPQGVLIWWRGGDGQVRSLYADNNSGITKPMAAALAGVALPTLDRWCRKRLVRAVKAPNRPALVLVSDVRRRRPT